MPTPSTPPGVRVDKQASLLLAPPSWAPSASSTASGAPRCRYREEYLEEDVQTLLSDWMDHADDSDEESAAPASDDAKRSGSADPLGTTTSQRTKKESKAKNKRWRRKLQWRPPGMAKSPKRQPKSSTESPPSTPTKSNAQNAPRLPPSASKRPHNHAVIRPSVPSSGASVTTFRSSASTIFTTKSSSTQKHSNRANAKKAPNSPGRSVSSSSVKSTTPPLARYRRRRKTALEQAKRKEELEMIDEHNASEPPRPSPPSSIRKEAFQETSGLETSAITEDNSLLLNTDDNSLVMGEGAANENDTSDEQSQVTFQNMKIHVTRNYTTPTKSAATVSDVCAPLDEAGRMCGATSTYAAGVSACLDGNAGSPTSVMELTNCGNPFDEYSHCHNMNTITDGVNKLTAAAEDGNNNLLDDGTTTDDDTVATIDKRKPGPIDLDTCTPHLTPLERRNLRAMHHLGYTHLRNDELPQALGVFAEILRGQKERHGKRSLQAATAMHNLGVVCMRSGRYGETVRLCDGASRIRVEELGKDSPEVAMSLAQQGVALMEMKEYAVALASFREALRIRRKALSDDVTSTGGGDRQLIVRLLNNIGCAHFELNRLHQSQLAFEEALELQRGLMKTKKSSAVGADSKDDPIDANPKDAFQAPLSIALTLTNLGSIHLRLSEFDTSLLYFEEAALIQESVLGDDHKVVASTHESIAFVVKSKEEQDERAASRGDSVKFDRMISAVMGAVSSKRCSQPTCADEDFVNSLR